MLDLVIVPKGKTEEVNVESFFKENFTEEKIKGDKSTRNAICILAYQFPDLMNILIRGGKYSLKLSNQSESDIRLEICDIKLRGTDLVEFEINTNYDKFEGIGSSINLTKYVDLYLNGYELTYYSNLKLLFIAEVDIY
jgi:hypothetical protein